MQRNPIKYYGGKQKLSILLLDYIPEHEVFVEGFGGAANLLIRKGPSVSRLEVYNDINKDVVNLFRVIRNVGLFDEFARRVALMPYSRDEFDRCLKIYRSETWSRLSRTNRATIYFYLLRSSFSAVMTSWSFSVVGRGMAPRAYLSAVDLLPELRDRLSAVQFENISFDRLLTTYNSPETFIYLDPPYLGSTRANDDVYKHEMTKKDHKKLLGLIRQSESKILLSGYESKLYDKALKDWNREEVEVTAVGSRAGRTRGMPEGAKAPTRKEVLWFNFKKPLTQIRSRTAKLV